MIQKKYDFRSFQIDYSSSAGAGRKRMRALVPVLEKMGALAPIVASSIYIYIYISLSIYIHIYIYGAYRGAHLVLAK